MTGTVPRRSRDSQRDVRRDAASPGSGRGYHLLVAAQHVAARTATTATTSWTTGIRRPSTRESAARASSLSATVRAGRRRESSRMPMAPSRRRRSSCRGMPTQGHGHRTARRCAALSTPGRTRRGSAARRRNRRRRREPRPARAGTESGSASLRGSWADAPAGSAADAMNAKANDDASFAKGRCTVGQPRGKVRVAGDRRPRRFCNDIKSMPQRARPWRRTKKAAGRGGPETAANRGLEGSSVRDERNVRRSHDVARRLVDDVDVKGQYLLAPRESS